MQTHIVYFENRDGSRGVSEFMDEEAADRIAWEIKGNGLAAEVFPVDDRPKLFAWRNEINEKRYRVV